VKLVDAVGWVLQDQRALDPEPRPGGLVVKIGAPALGSRYAKQLVAWWRKPAEGRSSPAATLCVAAWLLYGLLVVRAAWLCDDGFVSFRSVDNLIRGYGLTYNVAERVQAFTNPLWTLLMVVPYAATKHIYLSTIVTSVLLSCLAVGFMAARLAGNAAVAVLGLLACCLSKAFVDYSTSGLETPLTFCLLGLFFWVYLARRHLAWHTFWLFFLAAWLGTNRLDTVLLVGPALIHALLTQRSARALGQAVLGTLPLAAWELFACFYYGFLLPNTRYAKLNTNLTAEPLVQQGVSYLLDSASRDPVTLLVILLAIVLSFRRRDPHGPNATMDSQLLARVTAVGIVLYLGYVIRIGGDFMTGRLLTPPFFAAVVLLVHCIGPALPSRHVGALALLTAFASFGLPPSPWHDQAEECVAPASGIVSERLCYEKHTALIYNLHGLQYQKHPYYEDGLQLARAGTKVAVKQAVGLTGFAAGPGVYLVNEYAISEPLLARITHRAEGYWRIGHFLRPIPDGYLQTLETGQNVIVDPCLREFYQHLRLVIRGPVFGWERLRAVMAMNVGQYDYLLEPGCASGRSRHPE
jgi:arabinofuranosyltransferase